MQSASYTGADQSKLYRMLTGNKFPHTKSNDTEHDFSSWHHIPLPVSWFTTTELPEKEAGPYSTYSIGEEVSSSAPVSIAWSPPGIAKHRRCALGVLTSSLVMSIWASEGKTDDEASWKRKLVRFQNRHGESVY